MKWLCFEKWIRSNLWLLILAQAKQEMCEENLDQLPAPPQDESLLRNYI